jgi:hypothetical protein
MSLGPPQVSIEALNALAALLAAGGKSTKRGSRSRLSEAKEAIRAQEKETGSKITRAGSAAGNDHMVTARISQR